MASGQVSDLTVDELRRLIHQAVSDVIDEKLRDLLDELRDTDADHQFRPEVAAWILEELASEQRWDEGFDRSAAALARLAEEALAEHRDGRTEPLDSDAL